MYEWEQRKEVQEALDKEQKLRLKERERLNKLQKKEKAYQMFKEWLKLSLIKQREDLIEKKMKQHEQQDLESNERKAKENMKVMAKIAYKEWKEKK